MAKFFLVQSIDVQQKTSNIGGKIENIEELLNTVVGRTTCGSIVPGDLEHSAVQTDFESVQEQPPKNLSLFLRHLCPPLEPHSLNPDLHFCKFVFKCYRLMWPLTVIVKYAFLPGRTVVHNHVFSDLLRQPLAQTRTCILPALIRLYIEGEVVHSLARRTKLDNTVFSTLTQMCQRKQLAAEDLYLTLLATQYIVFCPHIKLRYSHRRRSSVLEW